MTSCDWTAWYSGGRVYHSRDVSWEDLPQDELQTVLVYKPDWTPKTIAGCDYYWQAADGSIQTHIAKTVPHPTQRHAVIPLWDHNTIVSMLLQEHGPVSIKWGKWESDEAYAETRRAVQASAEAYRREGAKWR